MKIMSVEYFKNFSIQIICIFLIIFELQKNFTYLIYCI